MRGIETIHTTKIDQQIDRHIDDHDNTSRVPEPEQCPLLMASMVRRPRPGQLKTDSISTARQGI